MKKAIATTITSLALAALPAISVCAIDNQSHDVTVGDVDETIYNVDVNWGTLAFDWKYDRATNSYDLKASTQCLEVQGSNPYNSGFNGPDIQDFIEESVPYGTVFTDENCSNVYSGEVDPDEIYYMEIHTKNMVTVLDYTENGKVAASASFEAESDYDWVVGATASIAAVAPNGEIHYYDRQSDIPNNEVYPAMGSAGGPGPSIPFRSWFYVKKAPNATVDTQSVTSGDKIGTLTINITPVTN